MVLKDLEVLYKEAQVKISNSGNFLVEQKIPTVFLEELSKLDIKFSNFTAGEYVTSYKDNEGYVRFVPHQWFYLANDCRLFLCELLKYQAKLNEIFPDSTEKTNAVKKLKSEPTAIGTYKHKINAIIPDPEEYELFVKFLTNYDWFRGSKEVFRGDFWNSSILNLSSLVHADGATFVKICELFKSNKYLSEMLAGGATSTTTSNEILIEGNVRDIIFKVMEKIIVNLSFPIIEKHFTLKTNTSGSGENCSIEEFDLLRIILKTDLQQSGSDLTTSGTLRWFETPIFKAENKFYYLSTQWTDNGGAGLDIINFCKFVNTGLKGVELAKLSPTKYSVKFKSIEPICGFNLIVYGAPGTGKSHYLEETFPFAIRTVFHGDYTNSDFIGSVRPKMIKENEESKVTYSFTPGPMILAIKDAITSPNKRVALLIEEINRADAATVFGEFFQLLDRKKDGSSKYSITISDDLITWISENCPKALVDGQLKLPSNLHLLATMNSADQGVQAMDSAFKRRWRFLYRPIDFNNSYFSNMKINYYKQSIEWHLFANALNCILLNNVRVQEDRLIGPYFLSDGEHQETDVVCEKLLLYLWDDVLRIHGREKVFNIGKFKSLAELQKGFKLGNQIFSNEIHLEMNLENESSD